MYSPLSWLSSALIYSVMSADEVADFGPEVAAVLGTTGGSRPRLGGQLRWGT